MPEVRSALRSVETIVKDKERVRKRRQQLVEAAVRVFLRKGFHAATVRDIGKEAGLTQGTIYNYVRSKDDILYLACDYAVNAYQDAARCSLADLGEHDEPLAAIVRAVIETMYDYQDYILLIYHQSHALDRKSLHAILTRVEAFLAFIKEEMVAAGVQADDTRMEVWANVVTFLPTMVALRRWQLNRTVNRKQQIESIAEFILKGLAPPV